MDRIAAHAAMAAACWSRSCRSCPSTSKTKGLEPKLTSTCSFRLRRWSGMKSAHTHKKGSGPTAHQLAYAWSIHPDSTTGNGGTSATDKATTPVQADRGYECGGDHVPERCAQVLAVLAAGQGEAQSAFEWTPIRRAEGSSEAPASDQRDCIELGKRLRNF